MSSGCEEKSSFHKPDEGVRSKYERRRGLGSSNSVGLELNVGRHRIKMIIIVRRFLLLFETFEKNSIYICKNSGKKDAKNFLLLCIKFVFYKKKRNVKAFISLQAKNFLAQITRVSSFDEVSPFRTAGIYQGIQLARI